MRIEIDQSGKVEKTHLHTYLAFSNNRHLIIKFASTDKQRLQKYFRNIGRPRMFVYTTFAVLVTVLIKSLGKTDEIVIDREYPGQEALILDLIKQLFSAKFFENLRFGSIGSKSKSHFLAYGAAIKKIKYDKQVSYQEIIRIIKMRNA